MSGPGTLVVAATPIGRTQDASPRLAGELATADVIAAEDTRRLRRLCADLGVRPAGRVLSYFAGNEAERTERLLEALHGGQRVLLVTDAGMPAISDPGSRLVAAATARQVPVTVVPGPSAVLAALAVSGLPADRFCFEGFLPRRGGERDRRLRELVAEPRTIVVFEAARRLPATLAAMTEILGADRPAVVCRELTKTHEEVRRGDLGELAAWAAAGVLGEVTVVVRGAANEAGVPQEDRVADLVARAEQRGLSRKDAVSEVAACTGLARRSVYEIAHRRRRPAP